MSSKRRFSGLLKNRRNRLPRSRRNLVNQKNLRRRVQVETLEDRKLMAASLAFTAPYELTINADSGGSQVSIHDLNPSNHYSAPNYYQIRTTSDDGSTVHTFHKAQIHHFRFNGSSSADVYAAPTGYGYGYFPVHHTVYGHGGNDVITTGLGKDYVNGGSGSDVIRGGSGSDELRGGSGRDRIWGESGNDEIWGNSGYDDLYGGQHNDIIYGGSSPDLIEGNEGNDRLYGGSSADFLYGGSGIDGLYGGSGADYLHGGSGSDRFLINTNETGNRRQVFDGRSIYIADTITDDTNDDIRVRFTNEGARTVTWPSGYDFATTTYTAGAWSETDITWVDGALHTIATETGNNALLYKSSGSEPQLFRLGTPSNKYIAFNDGVGNTHYSNESFTTGGVRDEDWANQVVFHEFGHNWDTTGEAERLIRYWGSAVVNAFRNASGWQNTSPSDWWNHRRSEDKKWWYDRTANFARDYARTNPLEDYAVSFAAYFMDAAGRDFSGAGADAITDKINIINSWVTIAGGLGDDARPAGAGGRHGNANAFAWSSRAGNLAPAAVSTDVVVAHAPLDAAPSNDAVMNEMAFKQRTELDAGIQKVALVQESSTRQDPSTMNAVDQALAEIIDDDQAYLSDSLLDDLVALA